MSLLSRVQLIFAALLFSVSSSLAIAQSFVNGGFETPNLPMDSGGPLTNGWTLTGCGGMATGGSMQNAGYPGATEGLQIGFYCADANIRQSLSLAAGFYQVSFKAMGNVSYPGVAVNVLMNNVALGGPMSLAGGAWNAYSTPVFQVPAAGSVEFKFATADPAVWGYVYMDDVRITPVAPPAVAFANGGFEAPSLAPGTQGALSGWTLVGSTGATFSSGSFTSVGYPAPPEGVQSGVYGTDSSIRQALALTTGNYQIKFRAMGNVSYPGVAVKLTMDGVQVGSNMAISSGVWQEFTTPLFAAMAGSRLFAFGAADPASWGYVYIDDVRITALANSAPTVSVTLPANNANVVPGATITLRAVAADVDGSIQSVEFRDGATTLATLTSPTGPANTYTFAWNGAAGGSHSITAIATDNLGVSTTSAPVTVNVTCSINTAPSISLASPQSGQVVPTTATIALSASTSDDGAITRVEFFRGTTKIGEDLVAPYAFSASGLPIGNHSITAVATDTCGAQTTSNAISVSVVSCPSGGSNPTVTLTSPTQGQLFTAPAVVPVVAVPGDVDGDLAKVEFFADGVKIGERTSPPYSMSLTKEGAAVSRTIWARATDTCGLTATSNAAQYTTADPITTPIKEPECLGGVGGLFTTGGQYVEANNGVLPNSYSMLTRWQANFSPYNPVSAPLSDYTGFGFAATASPFSAPTVGALSTWQRGAPGITQLTGNPRTATPGSQLYCNGGGMMINSWKTTPMCVEGGGYNNMFGYAWYGNEPDAFVVRFSDGTVYRTTDLLIQADMGVGSFETHKSPDPSRAGPDPHGEFSLFAYLFDVSSPGKRPVAIIGAAFLPGGSGGGSSAGNVDYPGGVAFVSTSVGISPSGDFSTYDEFSHPTVALGNGTNYVDGGTHFFRVRISPANWEAAILYINAHGTDPLRSGYSSNPADWRVQYAGVIAEARLQQSAGPGSAMCGGGGDDAQRDQVVLGTRFHNLGIYRRW